MTENGKRCREEGHLKGRFGLGAEVGSLLWISLYELLFIWVALGWEGWGTRGKERSGANHLYLDQLAAFPFFYRTTLCTPDTGDV